MSYCHSALIARESLEAAQEQQDLRVELNEVVHNIIINTIITTFTIINIIINIISNIINSSSTPSATSSHTILLSTSTLSPSTSGKLSQDHVIRSRYLVSMILTKIMILIKIMIKTNVATSLIQEEGRVRREARLEPLTGISITNNFEVALHSHCHYRVIQRDCEL